MSDVVGKPAKGAELQSILTELPGRESKGSPVNREMLSLYPHTYKIYPFYQALERDGTITATMVIL